MAEELLVGEQLREQVTAWLLRDQWKISEIDAEDLSWGFIAEDPQGRKVIVGQNAKREDEIILQARLVFDESTQDQAKKLPAKERTELVWDIRMNLLLHDVEFQGLDDSLASVTVNLRIVNDALTKDEFLKRISKVRKALLAAAWKVSSKFGDPTPDDRALGFKT